MNDGAGDDVALPPVDVGGGADDVVQQVVPDPQAADVVNVPPPAVAPAAPAAAPAAPAAAPAAPCCTCSRPDGR